MQAFAEELHRLGFPAGTLASIVGAERAAQALEERAARDYGGDLGALLRDDAAQDAVVLS